MTNTFPASEGLPNLRNICPWFRIPHTLPSPGRVCGHQFPLHGKVLQHPTGSEADAADEPQEALQEVPASRRRCNRQDPGGPPRDPGQGEDRSGLPCSSSPLFQRKTKKMRLTSSSGESACEAFSGLSAALPPDRPYQPQEKRASSGLHTLPGKDGKTGPRTYIAKLPHCKIAQYY